MSAGAARQRGNLRHARRRSYGSAVVPCGGKAVLKKILPANSLDCLAWLRHSVSGHPRRQQNRSREGRHPMNKRATPNSPAVSKNRNKKGGEQDGSPVFQNRELLRINALQGDLAGFCPLLTGERLAAFLRAALVKSAKALKRLRVLPLRTEGEGRASAALEIRKENRARSERRASFFMQPPSCNAAALPQPMRGAAARCRRSGIPKPVRRSYRNRPDCPSKLTLSGLFSFTA